MDEASTRLRCDTCLMQVRLCICAETPRLMCASRLILIINQREKRKATNSGALAARTLLNSEVHIHGAKDERLDFRALAERQGTNFFLFPAVGAVPLTDELCASLPKPFNLFVPDGNWAQAAKIRRKVPDDAPYRFVTLVDGPESEYQIRRQGRRMPGGLGTMEAIARAYAVLEGAAIGDALMMTFRLLIERTLIARGRVPGST